MSHDAFFREMKGLLHCSAAVVLLGFGAANSMAQRAPAASVSLWQAPKSMRMNTQLPSVPPQGYAVSAKTVYSLGGSTEESGVEQDAVATVLIEPMPANNEASEAIESPLIVISIVGVEANLSHSERVAADDRQIGASIQEKAGWRIESAEKGKIEAAIKHSPISYATPKIRGGFSHSCALFTSG